MGKVLTAGWAKYFNGTLRSTGRGRILSKYERCCCQIFSGDRQARGISSANQLMLRDMNAIFHIPFVQRFFFYKCVMKCTTSSNPTRRHGLSRRQGSHGSPAAVPNHPTVLTPHSCSDLHHHENLGEFSVAQLEPGLQNFTHVTPRF